MSFGRPPSINVGFQVKPPERGSFPLDHDGECRDKMLEYMNCLKKNSSTSTPCRLFSKNYLECRMSKGLMERDDFKNLGLGNASGQYPPTLEKYSASITSVTDKPLVIAPGPGAFRLNSTYFPSSLPLEAIPRAVTVPLDA